MHDVTNLVRSGEELRVLNAELESKNRELESKNEEITHFGFVASHDLKEPLRKMHTFTDWLLHNENFSEDGRHIATRMLASIKRMNWLIEDILVLMRIHTDPHLDAEVDLNTVTGQVAEELGELLSSSGGVVQYESLPRIRANENQMHHLLKNLLGNALKFRHPDRLPVVTVTGEGSDEEGWTICIRDNGIGFDKRYSRKAFQVFQRLHGKTYDGTGMGLAICKKIMENHGGTIEVDSEPEQGSSFCCRFPPRNPGGGASSATS